MSCCYSLKAVLCKFRLVIINNVCWQKGISSLQLGYSFGAYTGITGLVLSSDHLLCPSKDGRKPPSQNAGFSVSQVCLQTNLNTWQLYPMVCSFRLKLVWYVLHVLQLHFSLKSPYILNWNSNEYLGLRSDLPSLAICGADVQHFSHSYTKSSFKPTFLLFFF